MLWKRKTTSGSALGKFEEAKEATRRAAFLNVAQGMTADEAYKQSLAELFRTCRSEALAAGAAQGQSEADVDATIAQLCDADAVRMQQASDDEFRAFVQESGEIVNRFLSTAQR